MLAILLFVARMRALQLDGQPQLRALDGEIGTASLESTQGVECENIESQADR